MFSEEVVYLVHSIKAAGGEGKPMGDRDAWPHWLNGSSMMIGAQALWVALGAGHRPAWPAGHSGEG